MNENEQRLSKKNISELSKKFGYTRSLIDHWVESFGYKKTVDILEYIRRPYSSLWVQVNKSRIDVDSLIEIFEDLEFKVKKSDYFDDILEIDVVQDDLNEYYNELKKKNSNNDGYVYPRIVVDRESAQSIAMGKDVFSYSITNFDNFTKDQLVEIRDKNNNLIAIAKTEVNSNEIAKLSLNIIAKVVKSWAYEPAITELTYYRRGYYNVLTPSQVIGVKSLYLDRSDNILVMSVDKGDASAYIAELTEHKTPITVIANNSTHIKVIRKQLKRIKSKAIRVLSYPFADFVKSIHNIRYTSIYLELRNSRTAILPTFTSNLDLYRLKDIVKSQRKIIDNLYHCLHANASISLVNHSIDVLENEIMFNKVISRSYYEAQGFPQEIGSLIKKGSLSRRKDKNLDKFIEGREFQHNSSTIFLDPLKMANSGGFVSKFKFVLKKRDSL